MNTGERAPSQQKETDRQIDGESLKKTRATTGRRRVGAVRERNEDGISLASNVQSPRSEDGPRVTLLCYVALGMFGP